MSSSGISNPDRVDFVISCEDVFRFVIYEKNQITDSDAPALQQKLNNYLKLAEGEHKVLYPESENKQLCIMVDLYVQPTPFIMEVFKQYSSKAAAHNVGLELAVNGEVLISRTGVPSQPAVSAARRPAPKLPVMQTKAKKTRARQLYL